MIKALPIGGVFYFYLECGSRVGRALHDKKNLSKG